MVHGGGGEGLVDGEGRAGVGDGGAVDPEGDDVGWVVGHGEGGLLVSWRKRRDVRRGAYMLWCWGVLVGYIMAVRCECMTAKAMVGSDVALGEPEAVPAAEVGVMSAVLSRLASIPGLIPEIYVPGSETPPSWWPSSHFRYKARNISIPEKAFEAPSMQKQSLYVELGSFPTDYQYTSSTQAPACHVHPFFPAMQTV